MLEKSIENQAILTGKAQERHKNKPVKTHTRIISGGLTMPKCDYNCFECKFDDCILTDAECVDKDLDDRLDIIAKFGEFDEKKLDQLRKKRERQRAYYKNNKERFQKYEQENKEKIAKRKKEWYQRNKARISEQQRQYRQNKRLNAARMAAD